MWWTASSHTFLKYDITRSHCVASWVSNNGRLLISCHGFRSKLPKYNHPTSVVFWCAFRGPPRFFSCLSSLIFINTTRVIAALMFVYTFFSRNCPVIYTVSLYRKQNILRLNIFLLQADSEVICRQRGRCIFKISWERYDARKAFLFFIWKLFRRAFCLIWHLPPLIFHSLRWCITYQIFYQWYYKWSVMERPILAI